MMSYSKALDILTEADRKITELTKARDRLQLTLAALSEIENGAVVFVSLNCKPNNEEENPAQMCIDMLIDPKKAEAFIRAELEENVKRLYMSLLMQEKAAAAEAPEATAPAPEKAVVKPKAEIPEKITEAPKCEITKRLKVDRAKLNELFFKQGKSAEQIAQETGLGVSTVFKHIKILKAEKEQAAKELVRH